MDAALNAAEFVTVQAKMWHQTGVVSATHGHNQCCAVCSTPMHTTSLITILNITNMQKLTWCLKCVYFIDFTEEIFI
jgi:hypothetical protein